jgi:hypothetical protein
MAGVGAALGVVTQGVQQLTGAFNQLATVGRLSTDALSSAEQRLRGFAEAIPVAGTAIRGLNNMMHELSGAAEAMRRSFRDLQLGMAAIAAQAQGLAALAGYQAASIQAGARAGALGALAPVPAVPVMGQTAQERIEYAERYRLRQAQEALRLAQAEEAGTRGGLAGLRQRHDVVAAQAQVARHGAEMAAQRVQGLREANVPRDELFAAQTRFAQSVGAAQMRTGLERQSTEQVRQQQEQLARQEMHTREQLVGVMQAELTTLQQRHQLSLSTEERVGRLRPWQVEAGLRSAERVEQVGFRAASFFDREQAGRVLGPQWEAAQAGAAGRDIIAEQRERFQQASGGMRFDPSTGLAPQIAALQERMGQAQQASRQTFAADIASAARDMVRSFVELVQQEIRLAMQSVTAGFQLANANR